MIVGLAQPLGHAIWTHRSDLYPTQPPLVNHDFVNKTNQPSWRSLVDANDDVDYVQEWTPRLYSSQDGRRIVGHDDDDYDDYRDILDQLSGNFSNGTDGRLWVHKSAEQVAWRAIIVCLIMFVGILGNSSIIYSTYANRQFRARATNIFILNMAIADLFTTILCPVIALIKNVYQFYVLGNFVCRCEGFIKSKLC